MQRPERVFRVALGGRNPADDLVEQLDDAGAGLGGDPQYLIARKAEHALDLLGIAVGIRGGKVDLVERGDDLEVVLQGEIAVGERLRLDPLRRVDEEHDSFACGEASRDLVAEIDVARSVDELEDVVAPVNADVLRLDGDAAFAFEVHRVEVLGPHVSGVDRVGQLEDSIRQRRLAMVDVADDREVADYLGATTPSIVPSRPGCAVRFGQLVLSFIPEAVFLLPVRVEGRMANIKSQIKRNRQNERRRVATSPCDRN